MPMIETSRSRGAAKTAPEKRRRAQERPITWPDVLSVLQSDETRSLALGQFRSSGFTPDDVGHLRAARSALCEALIRQEDRIEMLALDHPRRRERYDAERLAIRAVRRRIETELHP